MKKLTIMLNVGVLLLASLFIFAGCSNDSSSDSDSGGKSAGKGVLGQVSGVVYNSVTAQPIKDVSVELGKTSVKTNSSGSFLIKDVEPGTYTVSFHKDGFQFKTKNVVVDPQAYIDDDPFKETEALTEQLTALQTWVENQKKIPDYDGFGVDGSTGSLTWTYQDGIYIDGNNAAVTVKNDNGQFVIEPIKLDYTYKKGIPLYITSLAPLTGAIKVRVKLFTKPYSEYLSEKLAQPVAIDEGVEFWFEDLNSTAIGWGQDELNGDHGQQPTYTLPLDDDTAPNEAGTSALYGPAKTDKNGELLFTGLPVGAELKLVSNGFFKKDTNYFFRASTTVYSYFVFDDTELTEVCCFIPLNNTGSGKTQNYTDCGTVYLFTDGAFVIVTDTDTGSPDNPKVPPTDKITLTFSEAIDQSTFTAKLWQTENAYVLGDMLAPEEVALTGDWSEDSTTVDLYPATAAKVGGLRPIFTYSEDGTKPIGHIGVKGKSVSGARILAKFEESDGIPVFTEEAIKLLEVDIDAGDIPTSRANITVTAEAIKLIFNKDISPNSRFWLGNADYGTSGNQVQFTIADNSVFIWTDLLKITPQSLYFAVISAADPNDFRGTLTTGVNASTGNLFQKDYVTRLVLKSTNIYDNGFVSPRGADAKFTVSGAITLTFDKDILPAGASVNDYVRVALTKGSTAANANQSQELLNTSSIALTKAVSGKTLTITPRVPLEYETAYNLDVLISKGAGTWTTTDVYFRTQDLVDATFVARSGNNIAFWTQDNIVWNTQPLAFADTNATSTGLIVTAVAATATTPAGWSISGSIKTNTNYYVQFSRDLIYTPPVNFELTGASTAGYSLVVSKYADNILQIRVNAASAAAATGNVTLNNAIGALVSGSRNGAINTPYPVSAAAGTLGSLTFAFTGITNE